MPMLPPLNALRAFEVAARTGSFVLAGAEMGVTSAAISQQVRVLEEHLGKKLFLRQGNRILLTDAGRAIYPRIEMALGDLASVTDEVRSGPQRARLVVSVLPSVAELWLAPALVGFDVGGLDLRVEEDPVTLARDGVDLRITYGGYAYPDHHIEPLFRDRIVPVAALQLVSSVGEALEGLEEELFVHTDWGPTYATQPSWAAWFAETGSARRPDLRKGLVVGTSGLAAAVARAGVGVALVPERIIAHDLAKGTLVRLDPRGLLMSWDYVLVWPSALSRKAILRDLVAHLKRTGVSP